MAICEKPNWLTFAPEKPIFCTVMKIAGTGSVLPKKVVTNDMLAEFLDTSDEWIYPRTGATAAFHRATKLYSAPLVQDLYRVLL